MSRIDSLAASLPPIDNCSIAQIDQEIRDELEFHVEMRTLENIQAGMSPAGAREAAESRFGDFERIRRTCLQTLLGERIMVQRIQAVSTVLLVVVVIVMGVQTYIAQQTNNAVLANLASAVQELADTTATTVIPSNWNAERPQVVETIPANAAEDVDPATTEIRVRFSKTMADGSWSWVQVSEDTFPKSTGDIRYLEDRKTCVMPVKLEPGKKYVVWFNSQNHENFKDEEGRPAVPYLLTFTTRGDAAGL